MTAQCDCTDPSVDERVARDDGRRSEGTGNDAASARLAGGAASSLRTAGHRAATVHQTLQPLRRRLRAPASVGRGETLRRTLLQVRRASTKHAKTITKRIRRFF